MISGILDSKAQDTKFSPIPPQNSRFHKQKFPGIRNTDCLTWGAGPHQQTNTRGSSIPSEVYRAFSLTWPVPMKNLLEQKKAFA